MALQTENPDILQKAQALRYKLAYIGEKELQEAVSGMAGELVELAAAGKDSWMYVPGSRSEQYLAIRTLKEVNRMTESTPEVRDHIKFSNNPYQLSESFKSRPIPPSQILILDDFVLTGNRMRGAAEKLVNHFVEQGYAAEDIAKLIRIHAVAGRREDTSSNRFTVQQGDQKLPVAFQSYFGVEPAVDNEGKPLFFSPELMTGSHTSTDYGFENPLDELKEFMSQNGQDSSELALPEHLRRPYEKNPINSERPNDFADPQLQADWEMVKEEYELV